MSISHNISEHGSKWKNVARRRFSPFPLLWNSLIGFEHDSVLTGVP